MSCKKILNYHQPPSGFASGEENELKLKWKSNGLGVPVLLLLLGELEERIAPSEESNYLSKNNRPPPPVWWRSLFLGRGSNHWYCWMTLQMQRLLHCGQKCRRRRDGGTIPITIIVTRAIISP